MRCRYSEKSLDRLQRTIGDMLGLEISTASTRGNTNHRIDLWFTNGTRGTYYPTDGGFALKDASMYAPEWFHPRRSGVGDAEG